MEGKQKAKADLKSISSCASGDERICKSLIDYFAAFRETDEWIAGISFGRVVAWLEKQKNK